MKILTLLYITLFISANLFAQAKIDDEPHGKVWGYAFGDYFYKSGGDSSGDNLEYSKYNKDFNSFTFRRIYLGYDYTINKTFETRVVLSYEGNDTIADGNRSVFVKDAYVNWKNIFANSDLTIGLLPTPGYSYTSEKLWSYRSIEKTIMDQRGFLSSRDLGVMLSGSFDNDKNYGYYLMIGNGRGTRLENNKYKRFYGTLFGNFLNKKLTADIYSDYEAFGNSQSKNTLQTFIAYKNDNLAAGAETFAQFQKNFNTTVTGSTIAHSDIIPFGLSLFINASMNDKIKLFGRYDFFNPDTKNSSTGFNQMFVTAGLDYMPQKNIHIMPNIWLNGYSAKHSQTVKRRTDVVPRITFYYEYR